MIKKFRRRFILLAMSALLLVLSLIIGGINIYNFHEREPYELRSEEQ